MFTENAVTGLFLKPSFQQKDGNLTYWSSMFFPIKKQKTIINLHIVNGLLPKSTFFAKVMTHPDICSPFQSKCPNCQLKECLASRLLIHCIFFSYPNFQAWLKKCNINKREVLLYTQELNVRHYVFFSWFIHINFFFLLVSEDFSLQFWSNTMNGKYFFRISYCYLLRNLKPQCHHKHPYGN